MHFYIKRLAWHTAGMNSAGIHIRAATEHDKPAVLRLAPRLAEGLAAWRDRQAAILAARQWLTDSFATAARHDGTVLVAIDKTGLAGVLTISVQRHFTGETDGYIGELAIASRAVRRGIGRALITAAETWAQDRGLRNLTLHTGIANIPARHFYSALGFQEEEIRLTRSLPGPSQTASINRTPRSKS
jgi:ribosomal protein S18 acetylase RimI-like enzyme